MQIYLSACLSACLSVSVRLSSNPPLFGEPSRPIIFRSVDVNCADAFEATPPTFEMGREGLAMRTMWVALRGGGRVGRGMVGGRVREGGRLDDFDIE